MTISATSCSASAVTEQSNAHDVRADRDRAPDEFAGMLAGAVNTPRQAPAPEKPRDGTSELDRPDHEEHEETGATKTKRTRAHAADSAATTADASATTVVQSVSALDPELQAKLARVMTRVRDETGHDAQVAETYRSQTRQDALFAQGRQTPGPVVTWTHNSKHTQGRAVDLVLDNGTAGLDAYAALQRIAGEEGLRTLGARDPGHLELPGTAAGPTGATPLIPAEPADATGPGQVSIARLAQVAQVAEVAVARSPEVARVAAVAHVAAPNDLSRATVPGATGVPRTIRPAAPTETQRPAAPAHAAANDAQSASRRFAGDSSDRESGSRDEHGGGYGALAAAVALRDAPATHTAAHEVTASGATSTAERAARLIAAFEDAPARPLSQITMSVDAGNGATDRIQVAMRGSSVSATIDAADARAAQSMTSRSDELARALSRDGIELEALRVRAVAGSNTAAPTTGSQSSSDTSTNSRSERGQPWQQQERQRSQDDRRDQQRDERGGRRQ